MSINVLLIEDNPGDARLVQEMLRDPGAVACSLVHVSQLGDGLDLLERECFDVLLLDLSLPDARGIESLEAVQHAAPSLPVVILSGQKDDEVALKAVQSGAQDYLVKGQGDTRMLLRAMRHAIERKHSEQRLSYLAQYDVLTGLPNRVLLEDRLTKALDQARRKGEVLALLYLDLDNFKDINDSLGHDAGDGLLQSVAERLGQCVRGQDTVARLAGDEFVILLTGLTEPAAAAHVAQKALDALSAGHSIAGRDVTATASVGIASYPESGEDADSLRRNADIALYRAKGRGGGVFQFYNPDTNAAAGERRMMIEKMRRAWEQNEFVLFYQPQLDLRRGRVTGMEALLRWRHPDHGVLPAARFIDLMEETGLILPVGEWVLQMACGHALGWQASGAGPVRVSVNLSDRQFRRKDLVWMVARVLVETGLEPACLHLEVSESVLVGDRTHAMGTLDTLRRMGVRASVDNFGSGVCALGGLRELPVEALNLDRSFAHNLSEEPAEAEIASALVALGHGLQLKVLAEGVESERELGLLRDSGCDLVQGNLISEPVPADACAQWLRGLEQRSLVFLAADN
ncbi:MAG: EAL domain-containing protein [Gammaproteobacteria bacterium]|nr:EAL domain-containing protein [Gammaproteobacteria bacterium]NIR97880.1 EAL domain-containing protein [Gammaproteobacteria bacterium]NIT63585.1 EAL domain-containing protein [Gammaproteobacteria bacterium]NIV20521.1 EAL domain-containing protein [Gammaproteobacteria bacterium]NIX11115.1 EAL domain-containing protein [Gammaproteobacteria bacterium]